MLHSTAPLALGGTSSVPPAALLCIRPELLFQAYLAPRLLVLLGRRRRSGGRRRAAVDEAGDVLVEGGVQDACR